MKKVKRRVGVPLLASVLSMSVLGSMSAPALGGTVAGNGGSSELTQLRIQASLLTQQAKQVQQHVIQAQQLAVEIQRMIKNPLGVIVGPEVAQAIGEVATLVEDVQSLGLSSQRIAINMKTAFGSDYIKNAAYQPTDYQTWNKTTKDTIRAAMSAIGAQHDRLKSEADILRQLSQESDDVSSGLVPAGDVQLLSIGNQVALQAVAQLQKLRQMDMAQAAAANAALLAVRQKAEIDGALTGDFIGKKR